MLCGTLRIAKPLANIKSKEISSKINLQMSGKYAIY